jgi:hypothetical protein
LYAQTFFTFQNDPRILALDGCWKCLFRVLGKLGTQIVELETSRFKGIPS